MSVGGANGRRNLDAAIAQRRRTEVVSGLRALARRPRGEAEPGPPPDTETCDLCGGVIPEDHRHLLNLYERHIVCACESCFALRSGEADLRPVGQRTVWLEGFELPEDVWASFSIPIGLAFFMYSSVTDCVVALYPSPGGATESELHFDSWSRLRELNPVLEDLEPDAEALIVNRMGEPPSFAIAPIDRCYMLVGLIKASWEGISGGQEVESAVAGFFEELRCRAVAA
jgi:hypothetical protein